MPLSRIVQFRKTPVLAACIVRRLGASSTETGRCLRVARQDKTTKKGNMPIRYRLILLDAALLLAAAFHGVARAASDGAPSPVPAIEDSMHERLQACVACHGQQGRGIE